MHMHVHTNEQSLSISPHRLWYIRSCGGVISDIMGFPPVVPPLCIMYQNPASCRVRSTGSRSALVLAFVVLWCCTWRPHVLCLIQKILGTKFLGMQYRASYVWSLFLTRTCSTVTTYVHYGAPYSRWLTVNQLHDGFVGRLLSPEGMICTEHSIEWK